MLLNDLITAAIAQQPVVGVIVVKERAGAYSTGLLLGQRASCTHSDEEAVIRLVGKVFTANAEITRQERGPGHSLFRISAMPDIAYSWASGLIEFGTALPDGAIVVAAGPKATLQDVVSVRARHGQGANEGKLLVPGVPEARGQKAAGDAQLAWLDWCAAQDDKRTNKGVVFGRRIG